MTGPEQESLAARYERDCVECLKSKGHLVSGNRVEMIRALAVARCPMSTQEISKFGSADGQSESYDAAIRLLEILIVDGYVHRLRDGSWFRATIPYSIPVITKSGAAFELQSSRAYKCVQRELKNAGHRPHRIYIEVILRD